jgi:hypothetical protein
VGEFCKAKRIPPTESTQSPDPEYEAASRDKTRDEGLEVGLGVKVGLAVGTHTEKREHEALKSDLTWESESAML